MCKQNRQIETAQTIALLLSVTIFLRRNVCMHVYFKLVFELVFHYCLELSFLKPFPKQRIDSKHAVLIHPSNFP